LEKAFIESNKAYCPKCKQCNYQLTNDYKLVEIANVKYTEFVARCMTDKCNEKFYFQSRITLDGHNRFAFDKSQEVEIKEEKTDNQ
jgi:hypothetical protein